MNSPRSRRNNSSISLKEWMAPVIGIAIGWFVVTLLFLHFLLEESTPLWWHPDASSNNDVLTTHALRFGKEKSLPATREQLIKQRYQYEFPPSDTDRIRSFVEEHLRVPDLNTQSDVGYDIYNCPESPDESYPMQWNVQDLLQHWNPNTTTLPSDNMIYQSLCVFDYTKDRDKALNYRNREVPFVLRNTPVLWRAAERWNRDESYLLELLGKDERHKTEHANNPHMMYWKIRPGMNIPPDWTEPTEITKLSYPEWLQKAKQLESETTSPSSIPKELYYFRLNAALHGQNGFLYNELPLFDPLRDGDGEFFIVDSEEERGINCRFGMRGIMAEAHFDSSRNFIVVLGGQRRYILAHPEQCQNMELYPMDHPSGRHSSVDWTQLPIQPPDRPFASAQVHEVVLQAGDVLYLPTHYFHFIVNLNRNFQCNARSGTTDDYQEYIDECGFGVDLQ